MSVAERNLWMKTLPHLVVPEVLACRYSAWLWRAWTVGDR